MNTITLVGLTIIFFYCVIQIFKFFGIEQNVYSDYLFFYGILLICVVFLPNDNPSI